MCTVGFDLGGSHLSVALVDEAGKLLARRHSSEQVAGYAVLLEAVHSLYQQITAAAADLAVVPRGIGVAVAGFLTQDRKRVSRALNLNIAEVELASDLAQTLGQDVCLANDADAAAWGEYLHGKARGASCLLMVTIGTGIGGGVVYDGNLLTGARGLAGEIGHVTIRRRGRSCRCGNSGCLERYASGSAIAHDARTQAAAYPERAARLLELASGRPCNISATLVAAAAQAEDPIAGAVMHAAARHLGATLASWATLLDPSLVVIGGGVAESGELLLAPLRDAFDRHLGLRDQRRTVPLERAALGPDAGLVGAGALARRRPRPHEQPQRVAAAVPSLPCAARAPRACDEQLAPEARTPIESHREPQSTVHGGSDMTDSHGGGVNMPTPTIHKLRGGTPQLVREASLLRRREVLLRATAGAGLLSASSVLAACGAGTKPSTAALRNSAPSVGGGKPVALVTFGVETDAGGMDYTQSYDFSSLLVVPSMTEPLLRIDQAGQLTPNLATRWDVSNPRRLVFTIRPGVSFQDGTSLTAEDVAYSMNRHLNPQVASLLAFYYANVARVEATGPLEVTAFMKQPDIIFLLAMSTNAGAVASKAFIVKHGKQFGTPEVGTLGTGPYRFVSWVKGQSFTVERNPNYWNAAVVPRKVERFTVRVITDESTLLAALRSGEIDGQLATLSGRGVQSLASASNIKQYSVPSGGASQLAFNVQEAPWSDPRVTRALSLVIPRHGLLDSVWGGQATLSKSIIPPSLWTFSTSAFRSAYAKLPNYLTPDVAQARKLVSAAGAHSAHGAIWISTQYDAQQAEAIQAAASQIGLSLSVNMVTQASLSAGIAAKRKPYAMEIGLWAPDVPDPANTYQSVYYSKSSNNYMGYDNPQVDAWLEQQSQILSNPARRAQLILKIQDAIVGGQVDPIIVSPNTVLSLNSRLGGYQLASPQWQWDPHLIGSLSGRA
jgi:peptide/nickel transport system substrate-binding protein